MNINFRRVAPFIIRKEKPTLNSGSKKTVSCGQIILDYGNFFAFLEVGKQQLEGDLRHANSITLNLERKTFYMDANAQVLAVNHIPQDYDQFGRNATVAGSVDQLIAAIEKGTPPASNIETAVTATETLMAAYQSIVEGRSVTLPLTSGKNPLIVVHQK